MLHLSIHAGGLSSVSRFNRLAWMDIGYEKLAAVADYKIVLFQTGLGATMPYTLRSYPRWSASLWDLIARALALGLSPSPEKAEEALLTLDCTRKRFAFANRICATIEYLPASNSRRKHLASVEIEQHGKQRGTYVARFNEHTMPKRTTEPFEFAVDRLRHAELLMHACLIRLSGKLDFPPRPPLCVPPLLKLDGLNYVSLDQLSEPARTGFFNWLNEYSEAPKPHSGTTRGIAPEGMYAQFLREAV